jgi:hypothetical protein
VSALAALYFQRVVRANTSTASEASGTKEEALLGAESRAEAVVGR